MPSNLRKSFQSSKGNKIRGLAFMRMLLNKPVFLQLNGRRRWYIISLYSCQLFLCSSKLTRSKLTSLQASEYFLASYRRVASSWMQDFQRFEGLKPYTAMLISEGGKAIILEFRGGLTRGKVDANLKAGEEFASWYGKKSSGWRRVSKLIIRGSYGRGSTMSSSVWKAIILQSSMKFYWRRGL